MGRRACLLQRSAPPRSELALRPRSPPAHRCPQTASPSPQLTDYRVRPNNNILLLVALFFTGCAGYELGPTNGIARLDKTIQVIPFENHTLEPRLTDAVTAQLRKQLQRDGTFQLATHEDRDIVVSGVITAYQRHGMSFSPSDTLTVRDFRLAMTAQVTARE